jgi:hypothetical protein
MAEINANVWDRAANTWRRLVDTATIAWDTSVKGQVTADVPDGGIDTAQIADGAVTADKIAGGVVPSTAADIDYDNSSSGLTATDVQDAIDEVEDRIDTVEAASGPGLVLIATQQASNDATIDFIHGTGGVVLDDTYDAYLVRFSGVKPQTDGVGLWLRVGTGGTPTWQADAADYAWTVVDYSGQVFVADSSDSEIEMVSANASWGLGNATGEAAHGRVDFDNPEASDYQPFSFQTYHKSAGNAFGGMAGMGTYLTAEAITGIRFLCSSGNIASGRFSLYGYAKA